MSAKLIFRFGSHAEKNYFHDTSHLIDGVTLGANVIESTPAATASFLLRLVSSPRDGVLPYYIDPMTYAFGSYYDSRSRSRRMDLDWIKSDQKRRGETVRDFKRSYKRLASELSNDFSDAVQNSSAFVGSSLNAQSRVDMCTTVLEYQRNRLRSEFLKDEEFSDYADELPPPKALFAPYFYLEPDEPNFTVELALDLMSTTARLARVDETVHGVLCVHDSFLANEEFKNQVVSEIAETGVNAVWLWVSRFDETSANETKVRNFLLFVRALSEHVEVYNRHGGYLSILANLFGMTGVSQGIGYGEKRDVVPVIGGGTPIVRYYLPAVHKRFGIDSIQDAFLPLGVRVPEDYHRIICDCQVCKGVIRGSCDRIKEFGPINNDELQTQSDTEPQSSIAARLCKFHFVLNRIKEREFTSSVDVQTIKDRLRQSHDQWRLTNMPSDELGHLLRWNAVIDDLC